MTVYEVEWDCDGDIGELFADKNDACIYAIVGYVNEWLEDNYSVDDIEKQVDYLSCNVKDIVDYNCAHGIVYINTFNVHEAGTVVYHTL